MAKFCKHCGAQLADGQICSCPQAQAEAAQQPPQQQPPQQSQQPPVNNNYYPPQQPPQGGYYQPPQPSQQPGGYQQPGGGYQMPAVPPVVKQAAGNVAPFFKTYFRAPVEAAQVLMGRKDLPLAIMLLAIQAVVSGLVLFSALSKLTSMILDAAGGGFGFGGPSISPSFLVSLLSGAVFSLVCAVAFSAILFGIAKIMKSNVSFPDALIASGANSIFVTVLLAASFVGFILSIKLGFVFLGAAVVAWIVMGVPTAQAITPTADQGKFWMLYIVGILLTFVVVYFVLPPLLETAVKAIKVTYEGETRTIGQAMRGYSFGDIIEEILDDIF